MKYKGRLVGLSVMAILILFGRFYGSYHYHVPFKGIPIFGIFAVLIAWWLGKQYDKVKFLSEKDMLTKIYNRRFVQDNFPKRLSAAKKNCAGLGLFLIDVNHFKGINDTHGHAAGDLVLQQISYVLSSRAGGREIAARWAGDEFLLFIPTIGELDVERIMAEIHIETKRASDNIGLEFSVSIGSSLFPRDGNNFDDLFKAADQNMYQAKSNG